MGTNRQAGLRRRSFRVFGLIAAVCMSSLAVRGEESPASPWRSVFTFPALQAQAAGLELDLRRLLRRGQYAEAEKIGEQLIALLPEHITAYYNLACAQALQGKSEAAFSNLYRSVERGFNAVNAAQKDADLAGLRRQEESWRKLLRAMAAATPPKPETRKATPFVVTHRVARVSESNTVWNNNLGILQSLFTFPGDGGTNLAPVSGEGAVGESVRRWFQEGTAAGLHGDLYDNRDGDHSRLNLGSYPQLTGVEYAPEARANGIDRGLQLQLFYNRITLGNASLAGTVGPLWRSLPRLAYPDARRMFLLHLQYAGNHIYMYPEHRDYDPGRNGRDGGHGDVYCGNCPYVILSQGSSGSDQPFMNAVACTLAAFRPDVKEFLAARGALMPAVQMLLRSSFKNGATAGGYLSGNSHRVVLDGARVDTARMVERAHAMTMDCLPPLVALKVLDEDKAVAGRDYFDPRTSEALYDTPAAIGRVVRSLQYERRMVVSAGESRDLLDKPLTYHWRVLQGDAGRIRIKPLNKSESLVEITVPYHERFPIEPGSAMEANRVDIGAFVNNGTYYSAPAFVSFFYLDNEKRVYGAKKEIVSVQYSGGRTPGNYVDPMVDLPKDWLDVYHYDDTGRMTGWTRTLGDQKQEFTADGMLIGARDASGKPTETRMVSYGVKKLSEEKMILDQIPSP